MITKQPFFKNNRKRNRYKGSSLVETAAGAFVLLPIFLVILDLIALVLGQTINDDISKKAARYAAQGTDANSARNYADSYMNGISYLGSSGLVANATIKTFNWSTSQVQVVTEVTINLPIGVPLGGPQSLTMQSQATEATIGVPATPSTGSS